MGNNKYIIPFSWLDIDFLIGKWLKPIGEDSEMFLINHFEKIDGNLYVCGYSAMELMERFEFSDGTPCGKIIEL